MKIIYYWSRGEWHKYEWPGAPEKDVLSMLDRMLALGMLAFPARI